MARNKLFTSINKALLGVLAAAVIPTVVSAAPIPGEASVGAVQQEVSRKPEARKLKVPAIEVRESVRPAMTAPDGFRVRVNSVVFSGNTAIPADRLLPVVADDLGKDMSFADLLKVADKVTAFYRGNGFLVARAYIPQQEISGGQIEIAVLEGRIGEVSLTGLDGIDDEIIASNTATMKEGRVLRGDDLERALLLLNDMAGLEARASLAPGAGVGTTNVRIDGKPTPDYDYVLDVNNFGSQYTGRYRFGATVNANNIGGRGDQLSLRGLISEGFETSYVSASYATPIDDFIPLHEWMPAWMNVKPGGTKFNISASRMDYEASQGQNLGGAQITGGGTTVSLGLTHAFKRSRDHNLVGQIRYDHKNLSQEIFGSPTKSDDRLRVLTIGLNGDKHDHYMGGGLTTYSGSLSFGIPNFLDGLGATSYDPDRPNSGGEFTKLNFEGARLQRISNIMSVYLRGAAQYSGYHLVSNEQFSLGGPSGVRAYTQGVGLGDDGWLLSAEARWQMPTYELGKRAGIDTAQFIAFLDRGASIVHNPEPGNDVRFDLGAFGLGLNLAHSDDISVKLSHAWTLDVGEDDVASTTGDRRFWLQAVKWFD